MRSEISHDRTTDATDESTNRGGARLPSAPPSLRLAPRADASFDDTQAEHEWCERALAAGRMFGYDWDLGSGTILRTASAERFGLTTTTASAFFEMIDPEDRPRVEAAVVRALEGTAALDVEYRVHLEDGSSLWLHDVGSVRHDAEGAPAHISGVLVDVGDRKRAELELADAEHSREEFLAMLAHELRNPLAPIRNATHILGQREAPEERLRWARDVIERQVEHLSRLVDELLDVSRLTRGRITLRKEKAELMTIIARAIETSRPLVEARKHELSVSLPQVPVQFECDPTRLVQVLSNLLNNAAKYTDEGGRIWLVAENSGEEIVIRVKDTGIGIPPDLLPRVFDLFTQAERSLDRSQGGLGIGLTLTRRLVELHGGRIRATSGGTGTGSEFIVQLPAPGSSSGSLGALRDAATAESSHSAGRRRILIVDDNVDSAESLAMVLGLYGHTTAMAHNGENALETASTFEPDVVLLDIGLPDLDGYEVARRMRAAPATQHARLIALTGYGQEEDRRRSAEAGFDHHVVKPVDPDELRVLVETMA